MVIGIRFFAEQISTLVGGIAVVAVMNHFVFPSNYLVIFSAGAACWWLCHLVLLRTRESVYPQVNTREHFVPFLRQLAAVAGRDRQFGRFLIFLILSSSSAMSLSLYTTVSMDAFLADATVMARDRYASICNVFLTGSFACGSLAAGALLRSRGFRPVMVVAAILCALGAVNACVAGNPAWFYMTFVLNGTSIGFFLVGMIEMLLAVTAPSQRLRYIAVANTTRGVFSMMFSLAGGLLTAAIGPKVTFAATAVLCFAAAVLLFGPECAPACERA
jgi:predicted MFS family arabinose efflux permease